MPPVYGGLSFTRSSDVFPISVPAVLQAAQVLSWESLVYRLFSDGSHSHVLVMVSGVCACCRAGCSHLEL